MKLQDSAEDRYAGLSDEELICRLRDGDTAVTEYILNKYKNLVRAKARPMYIFGGDLEDIIQVGMIGLSNAIRDFDCGRDASFATFAGLCVTRQIYTAVTASGRKKHLPLNSSVPLEADTEEGNNEMVDRDPTQNPESLVIDKENVERIENFIESELSPLERQTLELHMTGMKHTEIAKILGKDEKSTDNALQRAKSKLKKFIEEQRDSRNE